MAAPTPPSPPPTALQSGTAEKAAPSLRQRRARAARTRGAQEAGLGAIEQGARAADPSSSGAPPLKRRIVLRLAGSSESSSSGAVNAQAHAVDNVRDEVMSPESAETVPMQVDQVQSEGDQIKRDAISADADDWIVEEQRDPHLRERSGRFLLPIKVTAAKKVQNFKLVTIKNGSKDSFRPIPADRLHEVLETNPATGLCLVEELIRAGLAGPVSLLLTSLKSAELLHPEEAWGVRLQRRCIEWNQTDVLAALLQHFQPDPECLALAARPRISPSYVRLMRALQMCRIRLPDALLKGQETQIFTTLGRSLISFEERGKEDFNDTLAVCLWGWLWPQVKDAVLADRPGCHSGLTCWLAALPTADALNSAANLLKEWTSGPGASSFQLDWSTLFSGLIGIERAGVALRHLAKAKIPHQKTIPVAAVRQALTSLKEALPSSLSGDAALAFDRLWTPETTAAFDLQDAEVKQLIRELAGFLVESPRRNFALCGPIIWVCEVLRLLSPEARLELMQELGKRFPGSPLRFLQGMPSNTSRSENGSSPSARAWRSRLELLEPLLRYGPDAGQISGGWADYSWDFSFEKYGLKPPKLHELRWATPHQDTFSTAAASSASVPLSRAAVEEAPPTLAVMLMEQLQMLTELHAGWARDVAEQLRPFILGTQDLPVGWDPIHREAFEPVMREFDLPSQAEIWNTLFQDWGLPALDGCTCASRGVVLEQLKRARSKHRPKQWPLAPGILYAFLKRNLPSTTPYDEVKLDLFKEITRVFSEQMQEARALEPAERQIAEGEAAQRARDWLHLILIQGPCPTLEESLVQQVREGSSDWRRVLLEVLVANRFIPVNGDLRPWLLAEGMAETWSALLRSDIALDRPVELCFADMAEAMKLEGTAERLASWAEATHGSQFYSPSAIRKIVQNHPQQRDSALNELLMRTRALPHLAQAVQEPAVAAELLEACDSAFRNGFIRSGMTLYRLGASHAAHLFITSVLLGHLIRASGAGNEECYQAALQWLKDEERRPYLQNECRLNPQARIELYQAVGSLRPDARAAPLLESYVQAFDDHHTLPVAAPSAIAQRLLMSLHAAGEPFERGLTLIHKHHLPLATFSGSKKLPSGGMIVHASLAVSRIRELRALDLIPESRALVDVALPPEDMNAALDMVFGALGTDDLDVIQWALDRLGNRAERLSFELSAPSQHEFPAIPNNAWALLKIASTWKIPSERLLTRMELLRERLPRFFDRPASPWRQLIQETPAGVQYMLARAHMGVYRHDIVAQEEAAVMDKELALRFLSRPALVDSWSDQQLVRLLMDVLPVERANRPALPACLRMLLASGRWSVFQTLLAELPCPTSWAEDDQKALVRVAAHAGMTTFFDLVPGLRQVLLEPDQLLKLIIDPVTAPFVRDWVARREDHESLLRPLLERLFLLSKKLNPSNSAASRSVELRSRAWLDLIVDLIAIGFDPVVARKCAVEICQRLPQPVPIFSTTESLSKAITDYLASSQPWLEWCPRLYLESCQRPENQKGHLSGEEEKKEILALSEALERFWEEGEAKARIQPHRSDLADQVESQRACWNTLICSAFPEERASPDRNAFYWQSLDGEALRLRGQIRGLLARCALFLNTREEELRAANHWESEVALLCDCARCPTGTVAMLQNRLSALQIKENGGVRQAILDELHRIRESVLEGQRFRNTDNELVRALYAQTIQGGSLLNPSANVHQSMNLRNLLHARLGLTSAWQPRDAMSRTLMVGATVHEMPKDYWAAQQLAHDLMMLFARDYCPDDVRWALIDVLRAQDEQGFIHRGEVLELLSAAEERAKACWLVPEMPACFRGIQEQADAGTWRRIASQLKGVLQIAEGTRERLGLADLQGVGRLFQRAAELLEVQLGEAGGPDSAAPLDPRRRAEIKGRVAEQLAQELTEAYPHILPTVKIALRAALAVGVDRLDANAWTILHTTATYLANDKTQKSWWRTGGLREMSRFVAAIQEALRATPSQDQLRQAETLWEAGYRELIRLCKHQELDKELSESLFALKETQRSRIFAAGVVTRLMKHLGILVPGGIHAASSDAWLDPEAKLQLQRPSD